MKSREFDIITNQPLLLRKTRSERILPLGLKKDSHPRLADFQKVHFSQRPAQQKPNSVNSKFNYSNVRFNIINNAKPITTVEGDRPVYRREQISKFNDLGRLFAPNNNFQHKEKLQAYPRSFFRQRLLCTFDCDNMYTYGPNRANFKKLKK